MKKGKKSRAAPVAAKAMKSSCAAYAPTILRLILGLMFLTAGLLKLMMPAGVAGFLGGMGFPAPLFFAWLLLLCEIIFGLAVLLGVKVKYTVWPLVVIMVVAVATAVLPGVIKNFAGSASNLYLHLLAIAALVSLYLIGAGKWAVKN